MNIFDKYLSRLQVKAVVIVTLLMIVIVFVLSVTFISQQKKQIYGALKSRGPVIGKNLAFLAEYGVTIESEETLKSLLDESINEKDIAYIIVQNLSGNVLAKSDKGPEVEAIEKDINSMAYKTMEVFIQKWKTTGGSYMYDVSLPVETSGEFGTKEKIGVARIGMSLEGARKMVVKATTITVLQTVGLLILSSFFIWTFMGRIVGPINQVVILLRDVAEGEGDLTKRISVDTKDEVKELGDWFNQFIGNIERDMVSIKDSAEQLASGSEQITSIAQDVSQGAQSQSSTIEEITASVEELTSSINEVAKNANETNLIAQEASGLATEGGKAVGKSFEGMKLITKSSTQIADIIGTISDIADQTNLLALNAAIEAARAGEHGMGFAVVADEVRKLAERTQTAAKEITALIRESSQNVETGNKLSEGAGESLNRIVESIKNTTDKISQISASTEEQSATAGEVSRAVDNVSKITEENAGASEEMASSSEELASQAESLRNVISKFKMREDRSDV